MLTGVSGARSMAAAGVGVIGGVLGRTPAVHSAEQLVCNSSPIAKAVAVEAGNEPVSRLVFGGVPSFQESKEATTELKQFLEGMYLSSPQSEISFTPLNNGIAYYGSGVTMESNTSIPGPIHVHHALNLLTYSSTIQGVIVSLASDPKVFEAMRNNSAVEKLLLTYQTSSDTFDFEDEANATQQGELGAGVMGKLRNLKDFITEMVASMPSHLPEFFGSPSTESASKVKDCKSGSGFVAKLRNLKNSVVEMVTNIPKYFPNFYGFSAAESVSGSDHQGNTQSSPPELTFGTSLIGLAIMVIMIVVFKRV